MGRLVQCAVGRGPRAGGLRPVRRHAPRRPFGSGKIAAFDATSGRFAGLLRGDKRPPLAIEGLWALRFGNGAGAGPVDTLYFTAGIEDEGARPLRHADASPVIAGHDPDDNDDDANDHDDGD